MFFNPFNLSAQSNPNFKDKIIPTIDKIKYVIENPIHPASDGRRHSQSVSLVTLVPMTPPTIDNTRIPTPSKITHINFERGLLIDLIEFTGFTKFVKLSIFLFYW